MRYCITRRPMCFVKLKSLTLYLECILHIFQVEVYAGMWFFDSLFENKKFMDLDLVIFS